MNALRDRIMAGSQTCGLNLTNEQVEQLTQYLSHLEHWNRTINLTALPLHDFPAATLNRLIFEPLSSASVFPREPFGWCDFGSGGGSPAIPLRIVLATAHLTMVESRTRKAAFLRDVVRRLGLPEVEVLGERVSALPRMVTAGTMDIVTIRALKIDAEVAASVRHVLRVSGRLVLYGPVDWSLLADDFAPPAALRQDDVSVLHRIG